LKVANISVPSLSSRAWARSTAFDDESPSTSLQIDSPISALLAGLVLPVVCVVAGDGDGVDGLPEAVLQPVSASTATVKIPQVLHMGLI
jgi:hypothetical protein